MSACCDKKIVVKTEYIYEKIPNELLQTPYFDLKKQKAQNQKDIIKSYIILWSFYEDLKIKLEKINALQKDNK